MSVANERSRDLSSTTRPKNPISSQSPPTEKTLVADRGPASGRAMHRVFLLGSLVATLMLPPLMGDVSGVLRAIAHMLDRPNEVARAQAKRITDDLPNKRLSAGLAYFSAVEDGATFSVIENTWSAYRLAKEEYDAALPAGEAGVAHEMRGTQRDISLMEMNGDIVPTFSLLDACLDRSQHYIMRQHTISGRRVRRILIRRSINSLDRCARTETAGTVSYVTMQEYLSHCLYDFGNALMLTRESKTLMSVDAYKATMRQTEETCRLLTGYKR